MLTYQDILKRDKNPVWLRKRIFEYRQSHSLSQTATQFGCHVNTIKHIVRRGHLGEFSNRSRAPKYAPNRISEDTRQLILDCREDKGMGPLNLKHQYDIPVSPSTIYRVLKKEGCITPRKKKWKRSRDLRAYKQRYKAFEHVQVDGKCLTDILEFFPYLKKFDLPKHQFTFTCQKTGATFFAYSKSESSMAACTFMVYVFEHLKLYGIDLKKIRIKTDSGSFAIGHSRSIKKSQFTQLIQTVYEAKHRTIRHKNQNADVERFHGMVEDYFYKRVHVTSKKDFYAKAFNVSSWFNITRKNQGKEWKTPLQILNQDYPDIDPFVMCLPPINLDQHHELFYLKTNPHYEAPSFKSLLLDNPIYADDTQRLDDFFDDIEYFSGDANKSRFLSPLPGHHVMKLDGGLENSVKFFSFYNDKIIDRTNKVPLECKQ